MFYSRADEDTSPPRRASRRSPARDPGVGGDPVDPVLPEKKRARRRLIGALALVLAAVVGLPMILDAEPKSVVDDIDIQIPSKDRAAPLAEAAAKAPTSNTQSSKGLAPEEELLTPDVKPEPSPLVAKEPAPVPNSADKTETPKATSSSEVKLDTNVDTKGDTKDPKTPEAARAKALLEGKADPASGTKAVVKYVVQVAALASQEKIDELRGKLKGAGIESFTQRIATETGDRTRIRVGPFATKEEAEKLRAKILKLGLNGTLVPVDS